MHRRDGRIAALILAIALAMAVATPLQAQTGKIERTGLRDNHH